MSFYEAMQAAVLKWEEAEAQLALPTSTMACSDSLDFSSQTPGSEKPSRRWTRSKKWTDSEDKLLIEVAQRYQPDWKKVGKFFPGKPKSAVRRRWENRFDPDIRKTPWTSEEDNAIQELLSRIGPVWKEIAKALPGRPPDMVKNRYYGHIKRMQDIRDRKVRAAAAETTQTGTLPSGREVLLAQPSIGLLYSPEALQEELKRIELQLELTCFSTIDPLELDFFQYI